MKQFTLYGTSACHLCDVAHAMLAEALVSAPDCALTEVDIADSDELFERYGVRIPVLRHPGGAELGWPFEPGQVRDFLQS